MATFADLQDKFAKSDNFKKQMTRADENYQLLRQQSHYADLSSINKLLISKFTPTHPQDLDYYFIYGKFQPNDAKAYQKLTLYFITKIPKPHKNYTLVYFNDSELSNTFSDFKNILGLMPLDYFYNLQEIVLVKPTLMNKASKYFSMSTITKFINNRTVNVYTIDELSEHLKVSQKEILKFLPKEVRQDFLSENQQMYESEAKSLGQVAARKPEKKEIQAYDKSQRGIPEVFQLLLFYFKEHPAGLQQPGIFRKSVNIQQQTELLQLLSQKQYSCIEKVQNPHVIANLIKRFLANLKTPIIPYPQFQSLMGSSNINAEIVAKNVKELQSENMTKMLTLMRLMEFFKTDIIPHSNKNLMTVQNVAICIAPCLMWAPQASIKDLVYATKSVQVVRVMLDNFDQVFGNYQNRKELYRTSYIKMKRQSITEALGEKPEEEKAERLTPNFGEIIREKTENEIENISEFSEESPTRVEEIPKIVINNTKVKCLLPKKQSKSNEGQKNKKYHSDFGFEDASEKKVPESKNDKNGGDQNTLNIPASRKRGIFSSMSSRGQQSPRQDSKSANSIKSIHSDS